MSNALLLRLFTSEFFNSWIAVSYLFRYPDNVGIQHYLCNELKKFPMSEIEFFLPQLIHLLITNPSESVALECFLIELCETSTHMALMSLWYLQAYLSDLSSNPSSSSFDLCKRLLNKCQAIVFSDDHDLSSAPRVAENAPFNLGISAHKVRENSLPALVGMGAMLAAIGQPLMTRPAGQIAIAQGRRNRVFSFSSNHAPPQLTRRNTLTGASVTSDQSSTFDQGSVGLLSKDSIDSGTHSVIDAASSGNPSPRGRGADLSTHYQSASQPNLPLYKRRQNNSSPLTISPSLEDLHRGKAFSVSRYLKSAQRRLHRTVRSGEPRMPPKGVSIIDPKLAVLGQSSVPTNSGPASPTLSQYSSSSEDTPAQESYPRRSLASVKTSASWGSYSSASESDDDFGLAKLSIDRKRPLLRSSYFRSEIQFLLALGDIATRLVIVPKAARTSALHAELTLLNHNLPAEVCIPLWCPATTEKPYHHRVIRISPSDATVLNSAERAPYLLMIEVLDDDMELGDEPSVARHRKHKSKSRKSHKHGKEQPRSGIHSPEHLRFPVDNAAFVDTIDISDCSPSFSPTGGQTNTPDRSKEWNRGSPRGVSIDSDIDHQHLRAADEFAERMRTAAIMLAQLQQSANTSSSAPSSSRTTPRQGTEQIRQRIIKEMLTLEEQRLEKLQHNGDLGGQGDGSASDFNSDVLTDEKYVARIVHREDPSAAVFSEDWEAKKARIRASSPYGHLSNWRLLSVIVKNGADLRQEQFAIQLIREMQRIWQDTDVDVWVKYFRVLVTSDSSGLIETLRNTISIHSIKKDAYIRGWGNSGTVFTLNNYFEQHWGAPESEDFLKAQDAFMRSLAGYSVASYILQIKDRHNGNLLIDDAGHLIHIDFGFMLSNSPGSVGFEMAPFKLPQEYIDILGGLQSEKFVEFKALVKTAFLAVRKHSENILLLVEMMCKDSKLPCFQYGEQTIQQLRDRFQLQLTEPQAEEFVERLILSSCCNVFTRLYDTYQYYSQGIL